VLILGGSLESWFGCISDMQSIVDFKSLFRRIKGIHGNLQCTRDCEIYTKITKLVCETFL
jgi:hypothetical protein